ncbi:hypothetical protein [Streptomyces radiopugnans]|uniref:Ornithine cyclodeaminase/alanine dehydrogenase, mu-crystallin family n=1 Tax=Streptomyces radiopugnans TaxID=403935 RepID=A0A1H9C8S7_9ACTN|nr:hypothetical protein [Streptomyces radiopugnans]SEP97586.1 Ornithine cyclodeaminase/alanine dehydrogenase, mu-crystallin family [Streptomyces radiopugnans]
MMDSRFLRLDTEDLCALVSEFDSAQTVAEELLAHPDGGPGRHAGPGGRLLELRGDTAVLRDPGGDLCALPASGLYACRVAALTALAANQLLDPGVVTASLIGSGAAGRIQLLVIARSVPDVSHVAVHSPGGPHASPVDSGIAGVLEATGIGLTVAASPEEATFGASLVVVTEPVVSEPCLGHLAPGSVLVNATGRSLREETTGCVSAVYVDDLGLLDAAGSGPGRPGSAAGRVPVPAGGRLGVEADLRQVFTGEHPGRACADHVLLVELLSGAAPGTRLDVALAERIHRTALCHGLGALSPG